MGFVSNALLKGYRLGFQASSDHISTHMSYCNVWVEQPTRAAILEGMQRRRVYGATDNIVMRFMDVILGFPSLLLAIAIVAVLGPGLRNALIAIAIVTMPGYARVMRAQVLAIKESDYVSASRALGSSPGQILMRLQALK